MRVMAIDYGDVRTGVAVSDMSASIAGEAWVIEERSAARLCEKIVSEANSRGVVTIVVGYPKNMDGTLGPRAEKAEALANRLRELALAQELALEVVLWDERRTSVEAHSILSEHNRRGKKRKERVDAVAATLILEGYLHSKMG